MGLPSTSEEEKLMQDPGRAFVIGMGEVGRRIAGALAIAGFEVVPVTRAQGWEEALSAAPGPRLVCVGEPQLAEVVERLCGQAPSRLVFLQNGWVRPELAGVEGHTRGLIWFTSKGEFFRVLRPSPFSGLLAGDVAAALAAAGIAAEAVDEPAIRLAEAEKMGFNCVVGLPLAVHRLTLGEYLETRPSEAEAVFVEATEITALALGVAPQPSWWGAFLHVAEPLAWVSSRSPKAIEWRNGAVRALAARLGRPAPANQALLAAVGNG